MSDLPTYSNSQSNLAALKNVSEAVRDMKAELQDSIDALDEQKRLKTQLTDRLRSSILDETAHIFEGTFFEDAVSTYHDRDLIVLNEAQAIRQIIQFADDYFTTTGVDIIGSLLKLQLTNVSTRVVAEPEKFGLAPLTDTNGVVNHFSKGMEIKVVKR